MLNELMTVPGDPAVWLPIVFTALMGVAMLIYVILDGFDLGIGVLLPLADDQEKEQMIASIGPFWDANETLVGARSRLTACRFSPGSRAHLGRVVSSRKLDAVGPYLARGRL